MPLGSGRRRRTKFAGLPRAGEFLTSKISLSSVSVPITQAVDKEAAARPRALARRARRMCNKPSLASGIARACLNESLAGAGRVAIRTLQRPQQVQLVLAPLVGEAHPVMHSLPTRRARMRQNNLHTRGKLLNYR